MVEGRNKTDSDSLSLIAAPAIEKRILVVRGLQVILDEDLADLYGVETRVLVQQVRRNEKRFPADFMFQLSAGEFGDLKSQSVISSGGHGGRRKSPLVFTEHGNRDALRRFAQRAGHRGQYRDHARLRRASPGTRSGSGCLRRKGVRAALPAVRRRPRMGLQGHRSRRSGGGRGRRAGSRLRSCSRDSRWRSRSPGSRAGSSAAGSFPRSSPVRLRCTSG